MTNAPNAELSKWQMIANKEENPIYEVKIAIVGKYNSLKDAYKSLIEALDHAGLHWQTKISLIWLSASQITQNSIAQLLSDCDGILVPGGFGERDIVG